MSRIFRQISSAFLYAIVHEKSSPEMRKLKKGMQSHKRAKGCKEAGVREGAEARLLWVELCGCNRLVRKSGLLHSEDEPHQFLGGMGDGHMLSCSSVHPSLPGR